MQNHSALFEQVTRRGFRSIPLRKWLINIALIVFSSYSTCSFCDQDLPDLGNAASPILSPMEEFALGRTVLNELETVLKISNDPIITDYLTSLGYRIIATFPNTYAQFQFFMVLDSRINAFALPGGFIGVNSGLILTTNTESELAGVLAHEVGHVKQRHIARMYDHMGRIQLSTIAGLIASVILTTINSEAGTGAMAATLAGSQQAMINFTREHEREADFIGIQALAKAGFDPMGMASFFHRMYQETRFYGSWVPEYLVTHPLSSERLMAAQTRAEEYPYKQIPDSPHFHYVKARLVVLTAKTPQEATNYFKKALKTGTYRNKLSVLYGMSLALLEEGKPQEAQPILDQLMQLAPQEPLFLLLSAQSKMQANQSDEAITLLQRALKTYPGNYIIALTLANWLIDFNHPNEAILLIKKQLLSHPKKILLLTALSAAYSKANLNAQAHITQAQAFRLQGDYHAALTQLRLARKFDNLTDRERKQIDAQISEIQPKSG